MSIRTLGMLFLSGYSLIVPAAQSVNHVVSGEASCLALPATTAWTGSACDLQGDLAPTSSDTLTADVRLFSTTAARVVNAGGEITPNATMQAFFSDAGGGHVTNNAFCPTAFLNDATSERVNNNQLPFGPPSETTGTITNSGSMLKSSSGILVKSGLIVNAASGRQARGCVAKHLLRRGGGA